MMGDNYALHPDLRGQISRGVMAHAGPRARGCFRRPRLRCPGANQVPARPAAQQLWLGGRGGGGVAVASGQNLLLDPVGESKLKMHSHCATSCIWAAAAGGYAPGDGVAAIILKPLATALADGYDITVKAILVDSSSFFFLTCPRNVSDSNIFLAGRVQSLRQA